MYKLTSNGVTIEVEMDLFLAVTRNTVTGAYEVAKSIYGGYLLGYPGSLLGTFTVPLAKDISFLEDIASQIEDQELQGALQSIVQNMLALLEKDKHMAKWVEEFTGLSLSEMRANEEFWSLQRFSADGLSESSASLPAWVEDTEYKQFLKTASKYMEAFLLNIEKAISRLDELQDRNYTERSEDNIIEKVLRFREILRSYGE